MTQKALQDILHRFHTPWIVKGKGFLFESHYFIEVRSTAPRILKLGELSASRSGRFDSRANSTASHWTWGCMGIKTEVQNVQRKQILGPAGSQITTLLCPVLLSSPLLQSPQYCGEGNTRDFLHPVHSRSDRRLMQHHLTVSSFCVLQDGLSDVPTPVGAGNVRIHRYRAAGLLCVFIFGFALFICMPQSCYCHWHSYFLVGRFSTPLRPSPPNSKQ